MLLKIINSKYKKRNKYIYRNDKAKKRNENFKRM